MSAINPQAKIGYTGFVARQGCQGSGISNRRVCRAAMRVAATCSARILVITSATGSPHGKGGFFCGQ